MHTDPRRLATYLAVAIAAAAVAAILVMRRPSADDRPARGETTVVELDTALVQQLPIPVAEYSAECGRAASFAQDPTDFHAQVVDCLEQTIRATDAVIRADTAGARALDWLSTNHRALTRRLVMEQEGRLDAAGAREALTSAATLVAYLWERRYPRVPGLASEVADARRAARRIEPGRSLMEQRPIVEEAFHRIGNALILMSRAGFGTALPDGPDAASGAP